MRAFDDASVGRLNAECFDALIHYVGLGAYDFQIAFADVRRLQGLNDVHFSLAGQDYLWQGGPVAIPVWLLIDQQPTGFNLVSPFVLRMNLASGDHVDFHASAEPYETVLIEIATSDGSVTSFDVF